MSLRRGPTRIAARRGIRAAFLAPLLALALSAPASAAEVPNHPFINTLIGGLTPEPKPQFSVLENPCGISVQPEGTIFVSDYYRHKIFNTTLPNFYENNGPCALASDGNNLYVDYWHGGVVNPDFGVIDPGPATGIAVDPASNDLYVAHRDSVAVYESPVFAGGPPDYEIGKGSLGDAYGIAVSAFEGTKGYVYVGDASTNTVKVFDPSVSMTTPIKSMDGAGTAAGRFVSLTDATLALEQATGHLLVADNIQPGYEHPQMAIDEFNAEGLFRGQIGRPIIDGEPVGLAVDESVTENYGRIYVTSGNGSSAVFPPDNGPPVAEQGSLYAFGVSGEGKLLSVTRAGPGQGSVKSSPAGIACPGACEAEPNAGATVVLTATPDAGSAFAGWSGGGCSGTSTCQVTMDAATSVNAEFSLAPALNTAAAGRTAAAGIAGPLGPTTAAGLRVGRPSSRAATVVLPATLPGPGTVAVSGRGVKDASASSSQAGPITLHLHLSRRGARALAHSKSGALSTRLTVAFSPSGGGSGSVVGKTVTFKPSR